MLGNGALLYGPIDISCVAAATVVGKTKVVVSPTTLIAGSMASIEVMPQVMFQVLTMSGSHYRPSGEAQSIGETTTQ